VCVLGFAGLFNNRFGVGADILSFFTHHSGKDMLDGRGVERSSEIELQVEESWRIESKQNLLSLGMLMPIMMSMFVD